VLVLDVIRFTLRLHYRQISSVSLRICSGFDNFFLVAFPRQIKFFRDLPEDLKIYDFSKLRKLLVFTKQLNGTAQWLESFETPLWKLKVFHIFYRLSVVNPLTPNDTYRGRTAPLTSKRCILYIYSTNIGIEYFKYGIYSSFFCSSKCSYFHNSNVFGSCIIHILYTGCAKIKKIISAPKG
jgi:hypothetical protein